MAPSERNGSFPGVVRFGRQRRRPKLLVVLERMFLGAATMILSINIWTGFPLVALWIGSQFAYGNDVSMGAIVVAFLAFEIWFFFFAGSPVPHGS